MRSTSTWTKAEAAALWWDGVARKHCSPSHGRARQRPEAPGFSRVPRRLAGWAAGSRRLSLPETEKVPRSPQHRSWPSVLTVQKERRARAMRTGSLAFPAMSEGCGGCIFRRVLSFSWTAYRVRTAPLRVCGSQESLLNTAHPTTKHRAGQWRDFHCNTSSCLWGWGGRHQDNVLFVTVNEWLCY